MRLSDATGVYIGSTPVSKLYVGMQEVWSSSIFSSLNAAEAAQRDAVIAEMANNWSPDVDSIVWDDDVTVSSETALYSWLNANANDTRNQRVVLVEPFTNDRSADNDRIRGKDYVSNGKCLLIESDSGITHLKHKLVIPGSRGIYFRNVGISPTIGICGDDTDWAPGANTVTVASGGTGFTPGETLTLAAATAIYEPPVITVDTVGGSGEILTVTVGTGSDFGVLNANTYGVSASSAGSTSNASLNILIGTSPRDKYIVNVNRNSTFPKLPIVVFDGCEVGSGYEDAVNPYQWYSGIKGDNIEQLTLLNTTFKGYQNANSVITVRRFSRIGCDYQLGIGDCLAMTNVRVDAVISGGQTFRDVYPDGEAYEYSALNTARNLYDNAAATTATGKIMGLYLEHTDFGQRGTSSDQAGINYWGEFNAAYMSRITYRDAKGARNAASTQGFYNDDTTFEINGGTFSNILATMAPAIYTGWNATQVVSAYDTGIRVGELPPDGATVFDNNPGFLSRQSSGFGGTSAHSVRKSLLGKSNTVSGSGYVAGDLTNTDLTLVDASGGSAAYDAAFPTIGAVNDGDGRMSYPFTDDGVETQAAFRSRLYAAFGKSGVGAFDPAKWVLE